MMANFKTIETLVGELSPSYDAVVRYKEKVCVARLTYKGSYEAEIYDFCEEPDVDGFSEIECRIALIEDSAEPFSNSGEAIKWCFDWIDRNEWSKR